MGLAAMKWSPEPVHKVILAWLRAERDTRVAMRLSNAPKVVWPVVISKLLDHPDLDNSEENRARLRLFYIIRSLFFVEVPPDTKWYEVHNLTDKELPELRVINSNEWTDPNDKNELAKVAARKKLELRAAPATWEPPILWGHDMNGPFTIFEGNNRLTAYAASMRSDLNIPVFVGLSSMACVWHIVDNCRPLMQDLLQREPCDR